MKTCLSAQSTLMLVMLVSTPPALAQSTSDTTAVKAILDNEVIAWNRGDAVAYSQDFAEEGTFTNIQGLFFTGHKVFMNRHDQIFKGVFNKTVLQMKVVSLRFVRPDVIVVETLSQVSGFSPAGPPQGAHLDAKGRLFTRLSQVIVKGATAWKIASYHNVDVNPGILIPEAE